MRTGPGAILIGNAGNEAAAYLTVRSRNSNRTSTVPIRCQASPFRPSQRVEKALDIKLEGWPSG